MPEYNLEGLGSAEFERLVQSLLKEVIGDGTITFGAGPDGGREATFTGEAPYPSHAERWSGQWIFQAKFHEVSLLGPDKARKQVVADIGSELKKVTEKYGHKCDNYILATNVPLTPEPGSGTMTKIEKVFSRFRDKIPNLHVWGASEINRFLEKYTNIRTSYLNFVVTGDVLAQLLAREKNRQDEITKTMQAYLSTSYAREQNAQLDQAGDVSDDPIRLQEVFFDLAAEVPEEQPAIFRPSAARLHGFLSSTPEGFKVEAVAKLILSEAADRVVLVGGPGEGKSTAGQYISQVHRAVLLRLPDMMLPEGYFPVIPRLPFRVVLKDFGQWLAAKKEGDPSRGTLDGYICEHVEAVTSRKISAIELHGLITSNPSLLVLDGLDEVTDPSLKKLLLDRISEFIDRCTNTMGANLQILSSTRPIGYTQKFDMHSFLHLRLAKLEHHQVRSYVRKWAVARELDHSKSSRLFEAIEECLADSQINLLATTPLQVTILVLIISAGGTPPRQREALFDEYLEVIYKRETGKGHHVIQSEKELLIGLHKYVGYLLHEKATQARATSAVLTADDYEKYVRSFLYHNDPFSPPEQRAAKLRAITKEAGERLVLIVEPVAGEFGFELRSIQEFFAACHLADTARTTEQRYHRFEAIARHVHWRNVALFFAGRVGRSYSGEGSNITEVCRSIDDDGPDIFIKRGSELAIELSVDRALEPNRRGQRSLLEHGLRILESHLSRHRSQKIVGLLQKLPSEDIRDHLIPLIAGRVKALNPSRLPNFAEVAFRVGAYELAKEIMARMADGEDPITTLQTLLRLNVDLLEPHQIGKLLSHCRQSDYPRLFSEALWLPTVQLLLKLTSASHSPLDSRRVVAAALSSTRLVMPAEAPIASQILPLIRRSWSGNIEGDSVVAMTVITILKPGTLSRHRGNDSTDRIDPHSAATYLLPAYLEEGKLPTVASAEDSALPLIAPLWVAHIWLGKCSIETLTSFADYCRIAREHEATRIFLRSLRRWEMSPVVACILDCVDHDDDLGEIPWDDLLGFAGSAGAHRWINELREVFHRAGISKGIRYLDRASGQVYRSIREQLPHALAEYCLYQILQPPQMRHLNQILVQKLFEEGRINGPRLQAVEFSTRGIGEPSIQPAKALAYLEKSLEMRHPEAQLLVQMLLPWAMRDESISDHVLKQGLTRIGSGNVQKRQGSFSASAVVVPPKGIEQLIGIAGGGAGAEAKGAQALLRWYAYTWEWYRRSHFGLSKPRFRGFAELHRSMLRSVDPAVRKTGLGLFQVRLPQTQQDFQLLENALFSDLSNGELISSIANIAIGLEASPQSWLSFFGRVLPREMPDHVAAIFTEAYDKLLSSDNQSLRHLEDALGLPLQEVH
ncbi:NACHT domain-containing protein [Micromonospora parva]|uniref:NACHT domain-containing protein n=1 Tax=Micromonospora parva TaxID=1464048 RepID=UPI00340F7DDA